MPMLAAGGEDTEEEKQKRGFMEGTGMQAAQKQMEVGGGLRACAACMCC